MGGAPGSGTSLTWPWYYSNVAPKTNQAQSQRVQLECHYVILGPNSQTNRVFGPSFHIGTLTGLSGSVAVAWLYLPIPEERTPRNVELWGKRCSGALQVVITYTQRAQHGFIKESSRRLYTDYGDP